MQARIPAMEKQIAHPKPARTAPADITIQYKHLHPEVQKTIAEHLSELKIGKSHKTAGAGFVALATAGIIGGALTENFPAMGSALTIPFSAELISEGNERQKNAQGPLNASIIRAINAHGPVAKEHVEKYGLFYDPKVTWKKLARDYRHVIVSQNGDIHIVKELPLIPRSEVSHAALRKRPSVTA